MSRVLCLVMGRGGR